MARRYVVRTEALAVTTAISIIQLKAGATGICRIIRMELGQSASTTSAQVRVQLIRKSAAATVTSFTPLLLDTGDGAAKAVGGTSSTGTNASAEGTDSDIVHSAVFNVLSGYLYLPTPEERPIVPAGGFIAVKFPAAYTQTWTCDLVFEEEG